MGKINLKFIAEQSHSHLENISITYYINIKVKICCQPALLVNKLIALDVEF